MPSKYVLTLSTVAEAGRAAITQTTWTLVSVNGTTSTPIDRGVCAGDPHGDHARIEGRTRAKKHATSLGLRVTDAEIRIVYTRPVPPVPPAPVVTSPAPAPIASIAPSPSAPLVPSVASLATVPVASVAPASSAPASVAPIVSPPTEPTSSL